MQLGKVPALERGCVHKFWGRNKLDDHSFFSRGCKYASEPKLWNDNWDCSACPPTLHGIPMISAGSTCSQDLHHHKNYVFSWTTLYIFSPPSKCQFIDKCAKWPTPSGECKMYKLCKQVQKTHSSYHHQHRYQKVINIITLVFQGMIAEIATFATKNERRPSWLFCIFLFCDHKFASCANTSWENTAALCVNPNPLVNSPSVHKLVFGKMKTCNFQVIVMCWNVLSNWRPG